MTSLTPEVTPRDLGDGHRWTSPQVQPRQERVASLSPEVIDRDLGDGERWVAPQAQLRRRRAKPLGRSSLGEEEGVVFQSSVSSPSKRCGKGGSGDSLCGPCLVVSLLQCAWVMVFTVFVYLLYLEWC